MTKLTNDYSLTPDAWYRLEHEHAYMVCNILSIDFPFGFARNVFQRMLLIIYIMSYLVLSYNLFLILPTVVPEIVINYIGLPNIIKN
jgi:hypothetical protein